MSNMKSIYFPSPVADDMVRAILEGRKTVTRRVVKPQPVNVMTEEERRNRALSGADPYGFCVGTLDTELLKNSHYRPGDILYVRETWRVQSAHRFESYVRIEYKAGGPMTTIQFPGRKSDSHIRYEYDNFVCKWADNIKWHPFIHMPKKAARLFLRVTGVRVERLQEITGHDVLAEGVDNGRSNPAMGKRWENMQRMAFSDLWNSTVKKADLPRYSWAADPWVWVIAFERISREEACHD